MYLKAFDKTWNEYKEPKERREKESREAIALKVTGSAVEQKYHKDI